MIAQLSSYPALQKLTNGTKGAVRKLLQYAISEEQIWPGYQPIVDIRTGKVAGFEILTRWSDPVSGDISPDVFIGSLERLRLIDILLDAMIEKACSQARAWPGHFSLVRHQRLVHKYFERLLPAVLMHEDFSKSVRRWEIQTAIETGQNDCSACRNFASILLDEW